MKGGKLAGSFAPRSAQTTGGELRKVELVVKCDAVGVIDAIVAAIANIKIEGIQFSVIHSGVGAVSKSDLLLALSASRLVIGFQVEMMPHLEQFIRENGLEVRFYRVIYHLIEDLKKIGRSLLPVEPGEGILGRAKIIALFKSGSKDSIIGCEVLEGMLETGKDFRIVSAMGPIYSGKINSMQIEKRSVPKATVGQQVGIKIYGFNKAKVGDLVESFKTVLPKDSFTWSPQGDILHIDA